MVLEDWWRKKMYVKTFKETSKEILLEAINI